MIDIIVKIAGSIFCLGFGVMMLSIGLLILSALTVETYNRVYRCLRKNM